MKYTGIRFGTFAVFRGREFESSPIFPAEGSVIIASYAPENPDPSLLQWNDDWNGWTAEIPATDCDRLYRVNTYAKYLGHRVRISSIDESGMARIEYADWNGAWAAESGWEAVDKYEYATTVAASELVGVHENQHDELFHRWRDANFPAPATARKA